MSFTPSRPKMHGLAERHKQAKFQRTYEELKTSEPPVDDYGLMYPGPGPAFYSTCDQTSLNQQPQSTRRTSPRPVFGTTPRSQRTKKRSAVPGPGSYKSKDSIGRQHDSRKESAPLFTLRSRETFGSTANPKDVPGAGTYQTGEMRKANSKHPTGPQYSFARSKAEQLVRSTTPGPGTYKSNSSLGQQLLSQKAKSGDYVFGKSDRTQALPTNQAESEDSYAKVDAVGKQRQSTKQTLPAWQFGTSTRPSNRMNHNPGPATYRAPRSIGRQGQSQKKSAPSCSMSGREKFGSPWHTRR
jgi:hypothetical protein